MSLEQQQQKQRASSQLPDAMTITWQPNPPHCMSPTVSRLRGEKQQGEYVRACIMTIKTTFRRFTANRSWRSDMVLVISKNTDLPHDLYPKPLNMQQHDVFMHVHFGQKNYH
jgi:hypothetical protein